MVSRETRCLLLPICSGDYPTRKELGKFELLQHAQELKARCVFRSHKLKGWIFRSEYGLEAYRELAGVFPNDSLRNDPNVALSVAELLWLAEQIRYLHNDHLEDPNWGLQDMRQLHDRAMMLLATNPVGVNFEQPCANL